MNTNRHGNGKITVCVSNRVPPTVRIKLRLNDELTVSKLSLHAPDLNEFIIRHMGRAEDDCFNNCSVRASLFIDLLSRQLFNI